MAKRSAIVIGAGIVGLATARALAVRDIDVTVIERNDRAVGASIRNFGMLWPIGQPDGVMYERALASKSIWKEICDAAGIWYDPIGSLHVACNPDELKVLEELEQLYRHRNYTLLGKTEVLVLSPQIKPDNLLGALYSKEEMIVDPRKAIGKVTAWLAEKWNVQFLWGKAVTDIAYPAVYAGSEEFEADEIYVCNGFDFQTLYPELFSSIDITRCKLQMMRLKALPARIGPSICGALSLLHYHSFRVSPSLGQLSDRLHAEYPEHLKYGIHVMVSQNEEGELTVGDSHEYGTANDPFDKKFINDLVLDYLAAFTLFDRNSVTESWNGVYAKMLNNSTEFIHHPESGVTIINGIGGAGMTLSFGLCEEVIGKKI